MSSERVNTNPTAPELPLPEIPDDAWDVFLPDDDCPPEPDDDDFCVDELDVEDW